MPRLLKLGYKCVSWPALIALLMLLTAASIGGLQTLQRRSEAHAVDDAIDRSRLILDAVVQQNVDPRDFTDAAGLSDSEFADIRGDVNALQSSGQLVGLEVWRMDRRQLFVDDRHVGLETKLPEGERRRALSGTPWVAQNTGAERGRNTAEVFLPYRAQDGTVVGLVEIRWPQKPLTNQIRNATRWSEVVAVALLVALSGGLVLLRRRLRRRQRMARQDTITDLLNRAALLERARAVLREVSDENPAALLVIDLNGFRSVNDTLGYAAGDALLVQVAAVLRDAVRPGDVLARLGGDEFAVLMPGLSGDSTSHERVGANLLDRLRAETFEVQGVALAVDANIGVALAPRHGNSAEELLRCAQLALYLTKREQSGIALYDANAARRDVTDLSLLVALRTAIEKDELVLHYQPQVALSDGELVGVEALVRWQHPERGLLAPAAFVPLAEPTGLMQPLTEWVLRAAIRQAAAWQQAGTPMRVAVNISPRSLLHGHLPTLVMSMLADAGLPASMLELEITETAVVANPQRAAEVLRQLDAMRIKVSIDDFGAGYTSLAHLNTLRVKAIKVDRSLVTNMLDRPEDEAITEAVIAMGHRLGLLVLAEGVETDEIYQRLRELSCDEVQGYLLSRPLPPDALEAWLRVRQAGPRGVIPPRPALRRRSEPVQLHRPLQNLGRG